MNFHFFGIALLALTVFLTSCSSAPPAPDGIHDRRNQAVDFLKLGQQAFQAARYQQALTFFQTAATTDTAVDDEGGMAAAWNSVATAQMALGKVADAQDSLVVAQQMAEASKKTNLILQVAANRVTADLASNHASEAQALLDSLKPFPETQEGAALWHAQALVEKERNQIQASMLSVNKAYGLHQSLKMEGEQASDLFLRAMLQGHIGQWNTARSTLEATLALDRTMENTQGLGQDWRALGTVAVHLKELEPARIAYERSQRIFEAAGLKGDQQKSLELLLPVLNSLDRRDDILRVRALLDAMASSP